jgi:acetyl esterase/lipase
VFIGYGALAAAAGLVGITFNHRLYTDADYPLAADDVTTAVEQTRAPRER